MRGHVAGHSRLLREVDADLTPVTELLGEMARGGKRIRAAFCTAGARGASGGELPPGSVEAAAALELFHLAALIHDDVMDHSDRRRGRPTAHRHFAGHHRGLRWEGDPDAYGEAVAILAGDLCLTWSDDLIDRAFADRDLATRLDGRAVWSQMRDETIAGQYLDILGQVQQTLSARRAGQVVRFKSARYTVGHPLRLGGVLGGGSDELLRAFDRIGLTAGEAFQLRDDLLGVFGDPDMTGKPVVDDIREGKRTLLVTTAAERATTVQRGVLDRHLGDPGLTDDGLIAVCDVLRDTGAADEVERRIARLTAEALDIVDDLDVDDTTRSGIRDLVERCSWRRR